MAIPAEMFVFSTVLDDSTYACLDRENVPVPLHTLLSIIHFNPYFQLALLCSALYPYYERESKRESELGVTRNQFVHRGVVLVMRSRVRLITQSS